MRSYISVSLNLTLNIQTISSNPQTSCVEYTSIFVYHVCIFQKVYYKLYICAKRYRKSERTVQIVLLRTKGWINLDLKLLLVS